MALTRGRHEFKVTTTTTSFTAKDVQILEVEDGQAAIVEAHVWCYGGGRKYLVLRGKFLGDPAGVIMQAGVTQRVVYESLASGGATTTVTASSTKVNVQVQAGGTSLRTWEITVIALVY